MLGGGGPGLSGFALLLHQRGIRVTASDRRESPVLDRLRHAGINVHIGPEPNRAGAADWLVTPATISDDHPEVVAARTHGTAVLVREDALCALFAATGADALPVLVLGEVHRSAATAAAAVMAGPDAGCLCGALPRDGSEGVRDGNPFFVEWSAAHPLPDHVRCLLVTDPLDHPAGVDWPAVPTIRRVASDPTGLSFSNGTSTVSFVLRAATNTWTLLHDGKRICHGDGGRPAALAAAAAAALLKLCNIPIVRSHVPAVAGQWVAYRGLRTAIHDVRTHPTAVRALVEMAAVVRPTAVVFRPWSASFEIYDIETLAGAFQGASAVWVLPPYPGTDPDAHERLAHAIRARGGLARAADDETVLQSREMYDVWLALGGEDVAVLARALSN